MSHGSLNSFWIFVFVMRKKSLENKEIYNNIYDKLCCNVLRWPKQNKFNERGGKKFEHTQTHEV